MKMKIIYSREIVTQNTHPPLASASIFFVGNLSDVAGKAKKPGYAGSITPVEIKGFDVR
jgi:hypothetical protein